MLGHPHWDVRAAWPWPSWCHLAKCRQGPRRPQTANVWYVTTIDANPAISNGQRITITGRDSPETIRDRRTILAPILATLATIVRAVWPWLAEWVPRARSAVFHATAAIGLSWAAFDGLSAAAGAVVASVALIVLDWLWRPGE